MSAYGAEVFSVESQQRLTPDDFIHRLWLSGSVSTPTPIGGVPQFAYVSVPEMAVNDEWLVVVAGRNTSEVQSGRFAVANRQDAGPGTVWFSVYRR